MRHWIISHLPPHQYYAEPFAGAASILLAKDPAPKGEIINDLNGDVVNLFQVMQSPGGFEELTRRLDWTAYAKAELEGARIPTEEPIERARRMIVRSFMGIEVAGVKGSNSGFRMGNVDLSRMDQEGKSTFRNCARDWGNWKLQLGAFQERLARVMIYQRDAFEFIDLMDVPECLLYLDPPYDQATRSKTRYATDFTEHARLVERLLECRAMVVMSGYRSPQYDKLTEAGWIAIDRQSRANMSTTKRVETLFISPNAQPEETNKS